MTIILLLNFLSLGMFREIRAIHVPFGFALSGEELRSLRA